MYQIAAKSPNGHKLYQMAIKCTKWPKHISNGHILYQPFPFQGPPKFTQIGIFGLKIYRLATLALIDT
jgi:hypothetical protein